MPIACDFGACAPVFPSLLHPPIVCVWKRLFGIAMAPQKKVWRAEIVLLSADGVGTNEIKRRTGKSEACVWRWQERFTLEGFEGLLRDKIRPPRVAPLGAEVAARVVALTQADTPAEATHWTATMMAKATGISASSVQSSASIKMGIP